MKRFLVRCGGFAMVQLLVALVVLWYGRPDRGEHYLSSMFDKHQRLVTAAGPRLVVVGGSNVAFGINCDVFRQQLEYTPINLGLHVNLGLRFPLQVVQQHVRRGDVVVLSPEYNVLITENVRGSSDYIALMCQQWPDARRYFDETSHGLRAFLDREAIRHAQLWLRRARRNLFGQDAKDPIYTRSGFNRYGDMIAHYKIPRPDPPAVYPLPEISAAHLQVAVAWLNEFHAACRAKGATVVFSYPPIPQAVLKQSRGVVQQVQRTLQQSLTMPILNGPGEVAYRRELFYDTIYHLTRRGAMDRSQLIASRLAAHLAGRPDAAVGTRLGQAVRGSVESARR